MPQKLIDIKDADGKEGLMIDKPELTGALECFGQHNLESIFKERSTYPDGKHHINLVGLHRQLNIIVRGYFLAMGYIRKEEQSQRHVAVEVDREKLARKLYIIYECWKDHPNHKEWEELPKDSPVYCQCMNNADALIAHKEELFKIIYVKD